jgi:hypothetical protein
MEISFNLFALILHVKWEKSFIINLCSEKVFFVITIVVAVVTQNDTSEREKI